MKNIKLIKNDIAKAKVDAIVNAANPKMLGGGGVDGAIHQAAGPNLLEACRKIKSVNGIRCPFGEARITSAGNLNANFVIHTVGPIYRQAANPKALLRSAYQNSLDLALHHGCQSIAFPAISCGAYGYPIQEAAEVAFEVCCLDKYQGIEIHFYLFDSSLITVWQAVFDKSR